MNPVESKIMQNAFCKIFSGYKQYTSFVFKEEPLIFHNSKYVKHTNLESFKNQTVNSEMKMKIQIDPFKKIFQKKIIINNKKDIRKHKKEKRAINIKYNAN